MEKFHVFLISFLVCFQHVVFADYANSNEIGADDLDRDAPRKAEYRSHYEREKNTENPDDMVNELKINLEQLQKFARNVKPITTDLRHSMNSRRFINEENFFNLMRMASLKLLNTAERFVPVVKPILKIPRSLVHALLEE